MPKASLTKQQKMRGTTLGIDPNLKGASVLLEKIKGHGVKRIFGVPGRENAAILFNEVPDIKYITGRVEFNAGIMAEFTGRMTRKAQVCFSTMGPGATNMTTAVASARLNYSPTVFIMAQLEDNDRLYNTTHQCVDQQKIMEPLAKWSYELNAAHEIGDAIDKAFDIALAEPIGPVVLSMPTNFFKEFIPCDRNIPAANLEAVELPLDVQKEANLLHLNLVNSSKCIVLAAQEVIRANAHHEVRKLCEEWNIPLISSANAKGILPEEHELNIGSVSPYMEGILQEDGILDKIFSEVDTILFLGYQYVDDILPKMWERGVPKTILHLSSVVLDDRIKNVYKPNIKVTGDMKNILGTLLQSNPDKKTLTNLSWLKDIYKKARDFKCKNNAFLSPNQVMKCINESIGDGFLITDVGFYRHHAILFSTPSTVDRFYTDTGLSSFGTGLPSAIAAQFANPDKKVILICGDGGFHSGSCDLATAAKYNLPIIIILLNNSSFKLIDLYQKRSNDICNEDIVTLSKVDFVKLAEANGCKGIKVNTEEKLTQAISSHNSGPLIIECPSVYVDSFFESF